MTDLFSKTLNKEVPIPYYYQLKEILLDYIKNHHEGRDRPIPTEVEISAHFNISRPTVRQAINELVVEGYLIRQKGKGTFVTKPKISQAFLQVLDSFNNEMIKKGLEPSTKILGLEVVECDEKTGEALGIPMGSRTIQLRRLRFANGEPIVYVVTYLPYDRCHPILDKNLEYESLYEILRQVCGLSLLKAVRNLEAVLANEYEAKILEIDKGAPIQYIKSVTYLADESPIEYSLAKYRGDRSQFTFELGIR
ncbi:GntR family transcriptional regulator [Cohnella abietis]|uniref:HTH-type transcriptional repressor YvoA n=1 Tax=Cohnella abietis TaxID=2507935 RepID=A0A3T1D3Z4_9BACL|nr:GntR family transcriptional regulator [Cohnella abietis]BBI32836.1 HTH-type transcriptional repressor YvoA [Cohnella abietis]